MSIWKEIRKAINSTLGTDAFEPLNDMIMSGKGLVASENLYYTVLDTFRVNVAAGASVTRNLGVQLRMVAPGSVNVQGSVEHVFAVSLQFVIYKNNTAYRTITSANISTTLYFNKDDIITFEVIARNTGNEPHPYTVSDIALYADPIDLSAIRVTEV